MGKVNCLHPKDRLRTTILHGLSKTECFKNRDKRLFSAIEEYIEWLGDAGISSILNLSLRYSEAGTHKPDREEPPLVLIMVCKVLYG